MKNLIVHNSVNRVMVTLPTTKKEKLSFHYKSLFCYDQEPLNFNLYAEDHFDEERKEIFISFEGIINRLNNPIGKKLTKKENIAGHPEANPSLYDKKLLLHSEKNSMDLKKYERNGFLGVYYWSHAFLALDWYRFAKHDKYLDHSFNSSFDKDFNIYCRAWTGTREYRLKFLSMLGFYNIDKNSNIFFNEFTEDGQNFETFDPKNRYWKNNKNNIKSLDYITHQSPKSSLSAVYTPTDYHNSAIDIILETVFDQNKIHLTEKTLRPIACGKPFILVSEKNSLKFLRSYGFKTFDNLIDESYDNISCPKKRLLAITNTMKSISSLPVTKKNQLFFEMHKIAEENKEWFFSDEFFEIINNELKENLQTGFRELDNPRYQTAKTPRLYYRAYRRYKKHLTGDMRKFADIVINEFPERIELSKKNIGIS